jgi:hypothetical protein
MGRVPPILLQPMNPLDFTDAELRDLADRVRAFDGNRDVLLAYYDEAATQMKRQWQTVAIWFGSEVSETDLAQIAERAAEWLAGRYGHDLRPKALLLGTYGGYLHT